MAGEFDRIFRAGMGGADMVFGLRDRAQQIRDRDIAAMSTLQQMGFEREMQPLRMQLEQSRLAGSNLDRMAKGVALYHTIEAKSRADMRRMLALKMFGNLVPEINKWHGGLTGGLGAAAAAEDLQAPAPASGGVGGVGGVGVGTVMQNIIRPPGELMAGVGGGVFTPEELAAAPAAPAGATPEETQMLLEMSARPGGAGDFVQTLPGKAGGKMPKVTTYWFGETGSSSDYANAFGKSINEGRVDKNSLALSPDQEALVRSQGVKPGDWLQVKLDDGSVVERRWDDVTRSDLTGRWDFHGGDGPDPNDGKRVVGFKNKGAGDFTPVGGGAAPGGIPFGPDDVSGFRLAEQLGLSGEVANALVASGRPLVGLTGAGMQPLAAAVPGAAPGVAAAAGGELGGLGPMAGLNTMQGDETLAARLAQGPRSAQLGERLKLAVAAMGGIEQVMQEEPELGMQILQYQALLGADKEPQQYAAAAEALQARRKNRMETLGLAVSLGMNLEDYPEVAKALDLGVPMEKTALQDLVRRREEQRKDLSGKLAAMTADPNLGGLARAGMTLAAGLTKEKGDSLRGSIAEALGRGDREGARVAIERMALETAPAAVQTEQANADKMLAAANQAEQALTEFYQKYPNDTGPIRGRQMSNLTGNRHLQALRNRLMLTTQMYIQATTGAGMTDAERETYTAMFPSEKKRMSENLAEIQSIKEALASRRQAAAASVLGGLAPMIYGPAGVPLPGAAPTAAPAATGPAAISAGGVRMFNSPEEAEAALARGELRPGMTVWNGKQYVPVLPAQ